MSYLALARKWRPRTFSQLVGQEHINKALQKSLDQQRLHHAYLFTGTRGVGKTSIARLLAKALNCESGISTEPCLKCENCQSIEQGRFLDLIEIDGASRTRVEDTRELLENIQYAATTGRFKIYLIDEVHMLSQHSFNALLKTLEEPPAHVKFLLATTDPQKLPVTVLSRCLQFHLKPLQLQQIQGQMEMILQSEQYTFDEDGLQLIAKAAQGSMRDALSLLDQVLAATDRHLSSADVKELLGYTKKDYAIQLLAALSETDVRQILQIADAITQEGGNFNYVLEQLISYLHQTAIYQALTNHNTMLDILESIKALSHHFSKEDVQLFYQIGVKGMAELQLAPTPKIGFEMTLLRMLSFQPAVPGKRPQLIGEKSYAQPPLITPPVSLDSLAKSSEKIADMCNKTNNIELETTLFNVDDNLVEESMLPESETPHASTTTEAGPHQRDNWQEILGHLKLNGLAYTAAENTELLNFVDNLVNLKVAKGHQSLFTPLIVKRIEDALSKLYQNPIKLKLNFGETVQSSPAQIKQTKQQLNLQEAEKTLQNDGFLQELVQEFSAELVKNSIEAIKDPL